ncbi:MAG TPA: MFS transporter [Kofleriaceae bacterium]
MIALPCLLYAMDLTVLNLAVPRLVEDLHPTSTQLLWIVDIYGFVLAGALIPMGALGDRIGRRKVLLLGAIAFTVISVAAAFSTSATMLIAMRALLGIAGATLAPSTLALIQSMFTDPKQRAFAIGIWGASFSAGGALGPLLGGVMLEHFWWGSVFLLGLPVMLVLLATARTLLPEVRAEHAERVDVPSAALSLVAVLSAIYGIKHLARGSLDGAPAIAIAGILGIVFVRRQRIIATPLVDLAMFRSRAFVIALATNVLGIFAVFGIYVFVARELQVVFGRTPFEAALWMLPSSIGFVVSSLISPLVARRVPGYRLVGAGMVLSAAGVLLVSHATALAPLGVGIFIYSFGLGPIPSIVTGMIVDHAPIERAGAASALSETTSELGGALGIAILGTLFNALYDRTFSTTHDATTAFHTAFGTTGWVASVLLIATGALVLVGLRHSVRGKNEGTSRVSKAVGLQTTRVSTAPSSARLPLAESSPSQLAVNPAATCSPVR